MFHLIEMNELGNCLFIDDDEPFDERTNQLNDFPRMKDIYSKIYAIIDDIFEDID